VKEGDILEVKCVEIDSQGRVNLSRKAVLMPEGEAKDFVASRPPPRGRSGPLHR
jgi:predicted RNA-binding protein with RPS1 domain